MEELLQEIDLAALLPNFQTNKLDVNLCKSLSDSELTALGLETIGDRVRFKEALRRRSGNGTPSTGDKDEPVYVSTVRRTREHLFQPYNINRSSRTRRKNRKIQDEGRSWTATFVCLADKDSHRVPNSKEKILLKNSGLGLKKISFRTTDTEDDVSMKLQGEITGFPKLKESGGFELLSCVSNCRNLEVLKCYWNVGSLKSAVSAQTKIYIRPIQKNLKIDPEVNSPLSVNLKEKCIQCNKEIDIALLREHRSACSTLLQQQPVCDSDSEDLEQFTNPALEKMSETSVPHPIDITGRPTIQGQPATVSGQMSATSQSVPLPVDITGRPTIQGQPATVSGQMSATSQSVPLPVDITGRPTIQGQPATVSGQMSATSQSVPLPVDITGRPTIQGQPATVSGQMSATSQSVSLPVDITGRPTIQGQPATVSGQMSATSQSVPLPVDITGRPTIQGQPATVSGQMSATSQSVSLPVDITGRPTIQGQPTTVSGQMSATSQSVPLPVDITGRPTIQGQPATVSGQMSATSQSVPLPVDITGRPTIQGQPATVSGQMSATSQSVSLPVDITGRPTIQGQPTTVSGQMSATSQSVSLPVDITGRPTIQGQPATVSGQMSATSVPLINRSSSLNQYLGHVLDVGPMYTLNATNDNLHANPVDGNTENDLPDLDEELISVHELVKHAIQHCVSEDINNPVEILKYMQSIIVTGRRLEVDDISQCNEGLTNFILIDRSNILETAFDEIRAIKDLRPTLEVQFYDEVAVDYGGPRKEFFRLVLTAIKEKYFDHGLREHLAEDYITVGKIIALSILQNGKLPKFMEENVVTDLFSHDSLYVSKCIKMMRQGLDDLGIYKIGSQLPSFVFLLRPGSECTLTMKALTHLLKPKFSEEGSNSRRFEGIVYAAFTRYVREAASGRRGGVSLKQILQFVTGADEEPVLGFALCPSIQFCVVDTSFIPTANTCINCLNLPRPTSETSLPADENLFSLYDYAFENTFYGMF